MFNKSNVVAGPSEKKNDFPRRGLNHEFIQICGYERFRIGCHTYRDLDTRWFEKTKNKYQLRGAEATRVRIRYVNQSFDHVITRHTI